MSQKRTIDWREKPDLSNITSIWGQENIIDASTIPSGLELTVGDLQAARSKQKFPGKRKAVEESAVAEDEVDHVAVDQAEGSEGYEDAGRDAKRLKGGSTDAGGTTQKSAKRCQYCSISPLTLQVVVCELTKMA